MYVRVVGVRGERMPQRERQTYRGTVTDRRATSLRRFYAVGERGDVRVRKVRAKRAAR